MSSVANVRIHPSQFPEAVRKDLLYSLRTRQVNHKFHYDSVKQTQKWLALHDAYSPSRTDEDCAAMYYSSFAAVADRINAPFVHLIGLGCGGGQKDTRLLSLLLGRGKKIAYTPSDVSVAMVLVARATVISSLGDQDCHPLVCDLASAEDLPTILDQYVNPTATRLITFFGMIPNFEPRHILPRLASLVRPGDLLLFSANLAPGADYAAGVQRILPLYDNALTRDWLLTFLFDLGVEREDGELRFTVEDDAETSLKRLVANFHFSHPHLIEVDESVFEFQQGESIRLFFSYRHTPGIIRTLLAQHGLEVLDQWITKSEEEGVFLCTK